MSPHYLFPPSPTVALPIAGTNTLFPVHRVYCVGRNYADHAREMGSNPDREPPFFFCKPADALVPVLPGTTARLPYPSATNNFHYEIELVVALGKGGRNIAAAQAHEHICACAVGLDMTRRDLQATMKQAGKPWDIAKAFDRSAPISPLLPIAQCAGMEKTPLWLSVNGVEKQRGMTDQMTWSVAETIACLSTLFELQPGDLIFTGTPAGVGPVVVGDTIEGAVEGIGRLRVDIVAPEK